MTFKNVPKKKCLKKVAVLLSANCKFRKHTVHHGTATEVVDNTIIVLFLAVHGNPWHIYICPPTKKMVNRFNLFFLSQTDIKPQFAVQILRERNQNLWRNVYNTKKI